MTRWYTSYRIKETKSDGRYFAELPFQTWTWPDRVCYYQMLHQSQMLQKFCNFYFYFLGPMEIQFTSDTSTFDRGFKLRYDVIGKKSDVDCGETNLPLWPWFTLNPDLIGYDQGSTYQHRYANQAVRGYLVKTKPKIEIIVVG